MFSVTASHAVVFSKHEVAILGGTCRSIRWGQAEYNKGFGVKQAECEFPMSVRPPANLLSELQCVPL